ncbi:fructosamine kinase [Cryptococcus wingfieldii CBS 7118]|uniref:protein-ribulosamine 3-kinase n=1 Tax=Cryptococcus wingfieldii CBS 7118 TaxID=1295528 RepID=A0A1E3JI44_9TREE|nr:fructosamine kinase [Cryptococcus wingfieldii CBS 7118]ODO00564.1 fructosamine kinase [Cryptococcus wingfieldii CBS 7118]
MPKLNTTIENIFTSAGIPASDLSPASSSSGVVTQLSTGKQFFTKTQSDVVQMRGEVAGLRAMAATSHALVPEVIGFEISHNGNSSSMVSQWFDLSSARGGHTQRGLGKKIAEMHAIPPKEMWEEIGYTGKYGFGVKTHCGVSEQDNGWNEDWEGFWRDQRLGFLVQKIGDKNISSLFEQLKSKAIPLLLSPGSFSPPPKPVINHGDLWSGNAGYDESTSEPVIFDPASYWGHHESDLGVTHMFGGFTPEFYEEYHKIHPRSSPNYDERQKLYELYHHLNHTFMFGGAYRSGTERIMRDLIAWADKQ